MKVEYSAAKACDVFEKGRPLTKREMMRTILKKMEQPQHVMLVAGPGPSGFGPAQSRQLMVMPQCVEAAKLDAPISEDQEVADLLLELHKDGQQQQHQQQNQGGEQLQLLAAREQIESEGQPEQLQLAVQFKSSGSSQPQQVEGGGGDSGAVAGCGQRSLRRRRSARVCGGQQQGQQQQQQSDTADDVELVSMVEEPPEDADPGGSGHPSEVGVQGVAGETFYTPGGGFRKRQCFQGRTPVSPSDKQKSWWDHTKHCHQQEQQAQQHPKYALLLPPPEHMLEPKPQQHQQLGTGLSQQQVQMLLAAGINPDEFAAALPQQQHPPQQLQVAGPPLSQQKQLAVAPQLQQQLSGTSQLQHQQQLAGPSQLQHQQQHLPQQPNFAPSSQQEQWLNGVASQQQHHQQQQQGQHQMQMGSFAAHGQPQQTVLVAPGLHHQQQLGEPWMGDMVPTELQLSSNAFLAMTHPNIYKNPQIAAGLGMMSQPSQLGQDDKMFACLRYASHISAQVGARAALQTMQQAGCAQPAVPTCGGREGGAGVEGSVRGPASKLQLAGPAVASQQHVGRAFPALSSFPTFTSLWEWFTMPLPEYGKSPQALEAANETAWRHKKRQRWSELSALLAVIEKKALAEGQARGKVVDQSAAAQTLDVEFKTGGAATGAKGIKNLAAFYRGEVKGRHGSSGTAGGAGGAPATPLAAAAAAGPPSAAAGAGAATIGPPDGRDAGGTGNTNRAAAGADREEEPDGVRVSEGAEGVGTAPQGRSAEAAASRGAVAPVGATAGHLKETSGPKGVIRRSAAGLNSGQQSAGGGGGSKRAASKRQRDGRGKAAGPTPAEVFAESFPQAAAAVQLERKRGRSARH